MCLAMLFWPIIETLPALLSQPYSPFEIVWVRYGTHLTLMLVWWAPTDARRLVRTARPGLHALRAATMLGMPAAFVLAQMRMPTEAVMSLFWLAPLLAMLMARVGLGERTGRGRWLAAMAAVAGTLVILPPPGFVPRPSWIFPFAMAGCFALYQVLTRAMRHETTTARLFYTALGVWLPLSLGLPWFWETPTLSDLAVMMSIGVLGYAFLLALDHALDATSLSKVAVFALAQPLWDVFLSVVVHGRPPTLRAIGGAVIVLASWLVFVWPLGDDPEPDDRGLRADAT